MKNLKDYILNENNTNDPAEHDVWSRLSIIVKNYEKKKLYKKFKINSDLSVDYLANNTLEIRMDDEYFGIQFNKVNIFDCVNCRNLKSLEGAPRVCSELYCTNCPKLETLEGCPKILDTLDCSGSNISTLEGAPTTVNGWFRCTGCKNLISLKGSPKTAGTFRVESNNKLTSLQGGPRGKVGYYSCIGLTNLKSLQGLPKEINRLVIPSRFSGDPELDNIKVNQVEEV